MGFFFSVDKKDKDDKAAGGTGLPDLGLPGGFGTDLTAAAPAAPARTALDWTLDEAFAGGGAEAGRNSALTVLKLLAGLQALPPEARLVAVRAMDSADDTWDEAHVTADARKRIAILQQFIGFIDKDVETRLGEIMATFEAAKAATEGRVAELDRQMAVLKAERARQTNPVPPRPPDPPKGKVEIIEVEKKAGKVVGLKVNGRAVDLKSEEGKRTLARLIHEGRLSP